jgi:large subunit ribosomal protein L13
MKTYSAKAGDVKREWHVIDAAGQVLGNVSTQAAKLLMGKHKAMFSRHLDTGDYVVVINAEKVKVTGNKLTQKMYYRHSNYPGGLKTTSLEKLLADDPTKVIEHAVRGMLPRNRLEAPMMKRLRVFRGEAHPYMGQTKVAAGAPGPAAEAKPEEAKG